MQVQEIMSHNPEFISPSSTICEAAKKMRDLDTGFLPIGDLRSNRIIGTVTDRDIAIQAIAQGRDLDTPVNNIMHQGVHYCFETDDVLQASQHMREQQVRRLIVLNHDKKLTGVISLGDIAFCCNGDQLVGNTLKEISKH